MTKFADVDWEPGTPFAVLADYGFFAYSGEDGDLLRKHGLPGWRVSVYGRYLVRIQKNGRYWRGHQYWNTKREWRVPQGEELDEEAIEEFDARLGYLIEHGELPEETQ